MNTEIEHENKVSCQFFLDFVAASLNLFPIPLRHKCKVAFMVELSGSAPDLIRVAFTAPVNTWQNKLDHNIAPSGCNT